MKRKYPKHRVDINHIKNSWDDVPIVNGVLVGMLTDKLANDVFPSTTMKFNHRGGFAVVGTKSVNGGKTPSRPH